MTIEILFIYLLAFVVLFQQGFFMWQVNKLINKLMSKDYHSYSYKPPEVKQNGFTVQLPEDGIDRIKELNHSFKMPL